MRGVATTTPRFFGVRDECNTKAFIENSNNGHYIAAWRDDDPPTPGPTIVHPTSHSSAMDIASLVASEKYIFINP